MDRDEIEALLPFLANGTLEGDERRAVEAAVDEDPELQLQLDALKALRETMQAEEVQSPGDLGHARLMQALEAETVSAPTPVAANTNRPILWQAIAAALLAAVVGQFIWFGGDADGDYQLAGAESAASFTVTFAPDTTEEALRSLLLDAGVEIVFGPSALGIYGLAPLDGTDVPAARQSLEGSALVESLDALE